MSILALSTSETVSHSSQHAQHGSASMSTSPCGSQRTESFVVVESLLESLTLQQSEPQTPCFMVDIYTRNPEFYGRSEILSRLDYCLLPSKDLVVASQPDRTRVGVLSGMAGLGKTEAAIEYAYSRQHEFDCIFWIRAEDTGKLESDISQIATRLGIHDASDPHNKTVNKSLALGWLTNPYKIESCTSSPQRASASWLVIFDNADDPNILSPYKDIANCGAVLITSRNPLSKSGFSSSAVDVELETFDDKDAAAFLEKLTNMKDNGSEGQLIGSKLGGLPLAIAQMGGVIRSQYLSFSEFLDMWDEPLDETEVLGSNPHPIRETARGTISTIWAIEKLSKEARSVIEIMAFLDPDYVQDTILSSNTSDFSALPHYPKRKSVAFYSARTELMRSSLIRRNEKIGGFSIHRVVQHAVRAKMDHEHCLQVFLSVVSRLSSEWPSSLGAHDPSLWDVMETLYPHVISLRDSYLKYFSGTYLDNLLDLSRLMNRAAWFPSPMQ